MNRSFLSLLVLLCLLSCKRSKNSNQAKNNPLESSIYTSATNTEFNIRFASDDLTYKFIADSTLYGSGSVISISRKKGLFALKIETDQEFSDTYIDLEKMFGHSIDFNNARYLSMKLLLPEGSWIGAMKLNFKDTADNFGGVGEFANNFYENHDRWINVVVDLQELVSKYESWHGEENPLSSVSLLSLNPYNAHQAKSSAIYVHHIRLSEEKPDLKYTDALAKRIAPEANLAFKIDFDNDEKLQRYMAFRSFESSSQALQKGVAGNSSMAIRLKGSPKNKYIAFLPKLHEMTGTPVDFTKVSRIKFSYYLTDESDDFKSSSLYLVTKDWQDILYDENVFSDFKKGQWTDVTIEMKDLDLALVHGELPVLPSVYELRFGLEYFPNKKNIEMWIDDFQWE